LDFISELIDGWIPGWGSFLKINFGMTRHFIGLEKGVMDTRDVLYFIVMTVTFLMLNIFSIEDRMKPKAKFLFSAAVVVSLSISMVFNSLIFDIPIGRMDLTEGRIYTVSEATKDIFQKLKSPVLIKLYISPTDKMPTPFKTLEQDIKDRLEELKVVSNGKLDFKTIHMEVTQPSAQGEKKESLEDQLQQKGIQPFQVKIIEEDAMGIKLVYSAISIAYKEKAEGIIPRVLPTSLNTLEYDLMSKIYKMTLDKKPLVALVAPYSEKSVDAKTMAVLSQFGPVPSEYRDDKYRIIDELLRYEEYDLRRIRLTKEEPLPDDLNTLIIIAPESLNDRQRYEINRFLYEGGNVIIAAQGYNYNYSQGEQGISIMPQKNDLGLNELLDNYGIKISDDLLMDEKDQVISISRGTSFGPFAVSIPVKAPMQIMVDQDDMDQKISITSRLSPFLYLWGSPLDIDNDRISKNNLKATTLFTSSKDSWKVAYQGRPLERTDIEHYDSVEDKLPLGVLIEGQFPNSYKGQSPPSWLPSSDQAQTPAETSAEKKEAEPVYNARPGKLLVIGCSKMFEDDLIKTGGARNLFINSVDALTLGDELINIRSHQAIDRVVKKLGGMQKLWFRFLTIVFIPIVMIILGSLRVIFRRKEKQQYLELLPAKME
jgi:gliding-associated putative ABC transporter substrate-binding component GldG